MNFKSTEMKQTQHLALSNQRIANGALSSIFSFVPSGFCLLPSKKGFTLIELIMIITIVGILGISVAVKWPTGLDKEAAVKEFIHAFRYAQHQAMTREYSTTASAWGLFVVGSQYTVRRNDSSSATIPEYTSRQLLDDPSMSLIGPDVIFNGLGEPMKIGGTLYVDGDARIYTIKSSHKVTFCVQTGYIQKGTVCP